MSGNTETAVWEELHRIAPDIERDDVDPKGDLRDEFDIDSMDFLALVTALSKRLAVAMPERDYPRMDSVAGLVEYLDEVRQLHPQPHA